MSILRQTGWRSAGKVPTNTSLANERRAKVSQTAKMETEMAGSGAATRNGSNASVNGTRRSRVAQRSLGRSLSLAALVVQAVAAPASRRAGRAAAAFVARAVTARPRGAQVAPLR